jgi:hypothetical protein
MRCLAVNTQILMRFCICVYEGMNGRWPSRPPIKPEVPRYLFPSD